MIRLHDPYQNYTAPASSGSNGQSSATAASAPAAALPAAQPNWWETPDPPVQMQQIFVQHFLREAPKFGFFLETERFLAAFARPTAARPRPPAVLRNVVYLWGITLSQDTQYTVREAVFLGRTLRSVHVALSSAHAQPQYALAALQAEVLLANYFYHSGRLLEGKLHAGAAVSLALLCGLHQLHTPGGPATPALLPPPADAVEEAERIFAWWHTFVLDKSWVVALSAPAMIAETQEAGTAIHTPWPLTLDEYEQQPASARANPGSTVQRFLADVRADGSACAPLALAAQAAALYDRASALAAALEGDPAAAHTEAALRAADAALEGFKAALPPLAHAPAGAAADVHALALVHGLAHAGTAQLHRGFVARSATSTARALASASALVRVIDDLAARERVVAPLIGVFAATAGEVLLRGLQSLRSSRTAWAPSAALSGEDRFTQAITQLVAALERLGQSPFVASQTARLREALAAA